MERCATDRRRVGRFSAKWLYWTVREHWRQGRIYSIRTPGFEPRPSQRPKWGYALVRESELLDTARWTSFLGPFASTWNAEPTTTSAKREIGLPDQKLSLIGIYAAAAQVCR